jgi:tetratricopeptide (TPR) repeat protein
MAIANPYPSASFYLGSYYNEIGKHADALRVLDIGLALPGPVPGMPAAADHLPFLINERGAALIATKQWPEALANFDKGLAIAPLADRPRALLLRGRGFALTELGRLDEAEKSYRDSLASEPNNARALGELNYIARIRAGGALSATGIVPSQPPAQ